LKQALRAWNTRIDRYFHKWIWKISIWI
jgi:hypothetical protein